MLQKPTDSLLISVAQRNHLTADDQEAADALEERAELLPIWSTRGLN
jgi:hypothetical protein